MDEDVKVCPGCDAEFFAHVEECNKCAIPLVFPGEETQVAQTDANDGSTLVLMESGEAVRLKWLGGELKKAGIISSVLNMGDGPSCSDGFGLFVEEVHAPAAAKKMEEILHKKHPELKEMEENMSSGKCPACGTDSSYSVTVCTGCGLNLSGGDPTCGTGGCGD
ncbi:MAG: hypothetical protein BMS9Abin23_1055 [Thermodesulfobacteriota bacterium]|nr:MAG: hypothetical protein BMS9Abin23_1055 [Thermodesulfobacteriota bacterium]